VIYRFLVPSLFGGVVMSDEYDPVYIKKIVSWLEEQEARMKKGITLVSK